MALNPNEQFSSETRPALHGIHSRRNRTVEFATGTLLLPIGTIVALYDAGGSAGKWAPYLHTDTNGAEIPRGIVVVDDVQLDSDEEVLGVVMMEGEANIDDLNFPTASTSANFIASQQVDNANVVSPTLRQLNINITGVGKIG